MASLARCSLEVSECYRLRKLPLAAKVIEKGGVATRKGNARAIGFFDRTRYPAGLRNNR